MPSISRHKDFFRALLGEPGFADGLIRRCLPEDIAALVPDTPFVAHERTLDDDTQWATNPDGVYSMPIRDGRTLYVILELKSTPDANTPFQIAEFKHGILQYHERREGPGGVPPVIIPLVVYNGPEEWTVPRSLPELSGQPGDPFRSKALDAAQTPFPELSPDDHVRVAPGVVKTAPVEEGFREDVGEWLRKLGRHSPASLSRLVSHIVSTHQLTRDSLEELLREIDPELCDTVTPMVAEEWKEAGRAEGKTETLLRQLERRFGAVPDDARIRILAAPVGDIDAWLDAFVSASSLDDVFGNGTIR